MEELDVDSRKNISKLLFHIGRIIDRLSHLELQGYWRDDDDDYGNLKRELTHVQALLRAHLKTPLYLNDRYWMMQNGFVEEANNLYLRLHQDGLPYHVLPEAIYEFLQSVSSFRRQICEWNAGGSRAKEVVDLNYLINLDSTVGTIERIICKSGTSDRLYEKENLNHLKLELEHLRTLLRTANWRTNRSSIVPAVYRKVRAFDLLLINHSTLSFPKVCEEISELRQSVKSFRQQICKWNTIMWDSVIDKLELLGRDNYRRDEGGLNKLKVELKLIKIFFQCAMNINWRKQASPESSFFEAKSAIDGNVEKFYYNLIRLEDGLLHHELAKTISIFQESMNCYKQNICELYTSMLDPLLQSADSPGLISAFMEFLDSLLQSFVDIVILGSDPKFEQLFEPLQEKLIFLKNFISFATLGGSKPPGFTRFWIHCQVLAVTAARLGYMCWVYRADDQVFHELQSEISTLEREIVPVNDQTCQNYTQIMISSKKSRSSFTFLMEVPDHMHIVGDFVDSLLGNIWEFLYCGTSLMVSLEHQMQILAEGLNFLRTILKQQHEKFYGLNQDTKDVLIDVIYKAADIIFQLYMLRREEGLAKEMDRRIFGLLEEIELIKAEVAIKFPVVSTFNFPTTNELEFMGLILEKLKELASCEVDSVSFTDYGIQNVQKDLESLRSFLENIQEHRKHDEKLLGLWCRAIEVAYKAEFAIDSLIAGDISPYSLMLFDTIAKEITIVMVEALEIVDKKYVFQTKKPAKTSSLVPSQGTVSPINDVVVGFDDEARAIIDQLTRGSSELEITYIVGMPGLGKTTLAKKVYHDSSVIHHFHIRAWCYVSQVCCKKDVLLEILHCIVPEHSNQDSEKSEDDLAEKLRKRLKGYRYLIVLDDVWDIEAWNVLGCSFPNDGNRSRILLTGRNYLHMKPAVNPYPLRRLTDDECLELLQKKLVYKEDFGSLLQEIAKSCKGLPLTVVIMAGILANLEQVVWEEVANSLRSNIVCGTEECMNILELSYSHLPDHLKPCLLYFGAFLEDQEIPIEKLMWLWIAEGFVQKNELKSLEDTAEDYIMALISRNLVMLAKQGSLGGVKTCQIHDLLHEFCRVKSKEANFLQFIHGNDEFFNFDEPLNLRRLCIYSQPMYFAKSRLFCPRIRSLLFCFSGAESCKISYNLPFISSFKLLRVLDLAHISLGFTFPREIVLLVQLRYLAILGRMEGIPTSISQLSNLETFSVTTNVSALKGFSLPNSIWNMQKLRHLHIHGCLVDFSLGTDSIENSSNLDNLDTFSTPKLYLGQIMEEILRKFPNIRKLKCSIIAESEEANVDINKIVAINFPSRLESLKLILGNVDVHHAEFNFPSSLRKLTLADFSWSMISILRKLPNLEVLKLLNGAVDEVGTWDMKEEEFPNLKILKLEYSDIVSWTSSGDHHFPCLEKLLLEGCKKLVELPSCLEEISTLELIKVHKCLEHVGSLVRDIEEEHEKWRGDEGLKILITEEVEEYLIDYDDYFYSSD